MVTEFDVVVVGCGPVGSFCADLIARSGYRVAVLEENEKIGLPKHCSGLIHQRIGDILEMDLDDATENEIYGAHIHSKNSEIFLHAETCKSLVLDRSKVDAMIAERAEANGAEIFRKFGAKKFELKEDGIEINSEIKCKLLIGADGVRSRVARTFGLPKPSEVVIGYQVDAEVNEEATDSVEVFVGREVAPGFFGWKIPTGKGKARIGLGVTKGSASGYLDPILKKLNAKPIEKFGGGIPLGLMEKSYCSRVMTVGDAAQQVKPISGGGVNMGLQCAKHCAKIAIESLELSDFSDKELSKYQKLWQKDFKRELKIGLIARKIFNNLNDNDLDTILDSLNNDHLLKTVSTYGDIDYPSRVVEPIIADILVEPEPYLKLKCLSLIGMTPSVLHGLLG